MNTATLIDKLSELSDLLGEAHIIIDEIIEQDINKNLTKEDAIEVLRYFPRVDPPFCLFTKSLGYLINDIITVKNSYLQLPLKDHRRTLIPGYICNDQK